MFGIGRIVRVGTAAALLALTALLPARGQTSDAALRDRVNQLVERLDSAQMEARQAAEEALIKLGPRVLPFLPQEVPAAKAELRQHIDRVREKLQQATEATNLGASRVTIQAKGIRLSEVVKKLQAMTGNPLSDLREAEGTEAANPALDLEIIDKPFFEALETVCKKAEVTPSFFTGDGTIGLMAGAPPPKALVAYSGPFRVAFKQFAQVRDLQAGTATATAQFEVAWEPRLRPMLLKLKADQVVIVDDRNKPVEMQVNEESTDTALRPDNPVAELNLSLKSPERAASTLKSLKVKAEITVPAGLRTFRFPTLVPAAPATVTQGDIAVTLETTEVDEQVWKVNVVLAYPGEGAGFESFRQGLLNNRLWLLKADGSRFDHNGGFSNTAAEGGKLAFEYLFVDAPGKPADYGLVYETPSQVKTIPLSFEFADVPLP